MLTCLANWFCVQGCLMTWTGVYKCICFPSDSISDSPIKKKNENGNVYLYHTWSVMYTCLTNWLYLRRCLIAWTRAYMSLLLMTKHLLVTIVKENKKMKRSPTSLTPDLLCLPGWLITFMYSGVNYCLYICLFCWWPHLIEGKLKVTSTYVTPDLSSLPAGLIGFMYSDF